MKCKSGVNAFYKMEEEEIKLPFQNGNARWVNIETGEISTRSQFNSAVYYILNEMEQTPKVMTFIYGMMQAECKEFRLPPEKYKFAVEHFDELKDFDPHHEYTLNDMRQSIKKEKRMRKPLSEEAAELEDYFLANPEIKHRSRIRKALDDMKFFGVTKSNLDELRKLVKP